MSNILSIGDILEVPCERGTGYVSYAGKHSWLGDAIWVVPELFETSRSDWSTLFSEAGYFAFYATHAALRHKLIRKVGYALEALRPVPALVRTVINKDQNGLVSSWLITDGVARTPRKDAEMSAEERLLPIGSIWNHKLLCERLESRWRPDIEHRPA